MNNEDFPFGYEFVKKAALREINFGENDMMEKKFLLLVLMKSEKDSRYVVTAERHTFDSRSSKIFLL